jgi:parallel beta-helix repeat protein
VKSDGNDKLDGLSDATAWKTMRKVSKYEFKAGDDVYFKCGDTWKGETLWMVWGGTAADYAIVGAYHMANGNEIHRVSGKKPIINGNHIAPVATHPDPKDWVGLIQVSKQKYVLIENLILTNSEGHGVKIDKSSYVDIKNIETNDTYRAGIIYSDSPYANGNVVNNIVQKADMVWPEYAINNNLHWPAGLVAIDSSYLTIKNNKVFDCYGEGIGSFSLDSSMPARYNVIEDNIVYNNRAVQIYIANSSHNIIRRNLIYGSTTEKSYHRFVGSNGTGYNGPGLWVADESWTDPLSSDNQFYGNMIANCSSGIVIDVGQTGSTFKNSVFYNNTVIDCDQLVTIYGSSFKNSYIRNNIFGFINGTGKAYKGPTTTSGLTWEFNLWPDYADGSRASSNNVYGIPKLKRMTGWNNLAPGSVSAKDFALVDTATNLIDKGKTLDDKYKWAVNCLISTYPNNIIMLNRPQQNKWDIGADEFNEQTGALVDPNDDGLSNLSAPILSIIN